MHFSGSHKSRFCFSAKMPVFPPDSPQRNSTVPVSSRYSAPTTRRPYSASSCRISRLFSISAQLLRTFRQQARTGSFSPPIAAAISTILRPLSVIYRVYQGASKNALHRNTPVPCRSSSSEMLRMIAPTLVTLGSWTSLWFCSRSRRYDSLCSSS